MAVEQIGRQGADFLQVRLGGVYALERLARDSPRDQPTIIEVLSAFVRTNAPSPTAPRSPTTAVSCPYEHIGPDVQAGLTILGRRDSSQDQGVIVDVHETCLIGAVFNGANLANADFNGANLTNAEFYSDNNLNSANFVAADLAGVEFYTKAGDYGTTCKNTYFDYANLAGYRSGCRTLEGANLYRANLTDASLLLAFARGASFNEADLTNARLARGVFQEAHFVNANLTDANLSGADLRGANLNGARHDRTRVENVSIDSNTNGEWW
jgi:uncharacterized protein YjbI with pentapeptide repeats